MRSVSEVHKKNSIETIYIRSHIHKKAHLNQRRRRKKTIAKIKSKHKNNREKNTQQRRSSKHVFKIDLCMGNKYKYINSMYKYVQQITNMRSQISLKRERGQNVTAQEK